MNKIDTSIDIAGVHFKNPVIAASGTFGYGREYAGLLDIPRLGGICTKGLTLEAWQGNRGIRLHESPAGLINSIGLENPGIRAFIKNELPALKKLGPVVIANLSGFSLDDYVEGARLLDNSDIDMIELNISCPNVKAGGMAFGLCARDAHEVSSAVRRASQKPLMVKLSPNAPDINAIGLACEEAGADALSLVNTFSAMAIDIRRRRPVFDNVFAGLCGPAIRPLALRMLWQLVDAVKIPIVGMGGIANTSDAVEFLMAGASAIQVGAATFANPRATTDIVDGLGDFMQQEGFLTLKELIGLARAYKTTN